ncbi:MAG: winged helix-turn-helix domain-containing protein [Beijerinckiaceae bacterium]
MGTVGTELLQFDRFELDLGRCCLRVSGRSIDLRPKAFVILKLLAENAGHLVSKDTLYQTVWPGLAVGDDSLSQCIHELRQLLGDNDHRVIRTVSRRGYVLDAHNMPAARETGQEYEPALELLSPDTPPPGRPSIAVLPFVNISGDPDQEYFADGIVEDITTALSRIGLLFVIARNSCFIYKGRAVPAPKIGRELGVRYLLQGSIRRSGKRVRIAAQLINALSATLLWADTFDGTFDDIFDLQDKVSERVVGAIVPKLDQAEIDRALRKPTANLDAYDIYLRGLSAIRSRSREANDKALSLWRKAIELDGDFALAHAMAAFCLCRRKAEGWVVERDAHAAETRTLAYQAVRHGKDDAMALSFAGFALAFVAGDLDDGADLIDQALNLNPNLAQGWYLGGWTKLYLREPDAAIERQARALRLSPVDPNSYMMNTVMAHAHFFACRYEEAAAWVRRALRQQPDYQSALRIGAAIYALNGRQADAQAMAARLRTHHPHLKLGNVRDVLGPYRDASHLSKYVGALRRAGLPK